MKHGVLLVEDDMDLVSIIMDYLDLEYVRCDFADNASTAIKMLQRSSYDIVILGANTPGAHDLIVSKTQSEQVAMPPVIMLAAKDILNGKLENLLGGEKTWLNILPWAD